MTDKQLWGWEKKVPSSLIDAPEQVSRSQKYFLDLIKDKQEYLFLSNKNKYLFLFFIQLKFCKLNNRLNRMK